MLFEQLRRYTHSAWFVLVLACFVTVFPGKGVSGEVAGGGKVSLREVLQDITLTDPTILEAFKRYESILAERGIAKSEFYPTLGTTVTVGPEWTDGVPTNDESESLFATNASLWARQNLYNGGRSTARVAETDARILAAAYDVLNAANTVYLECAEAYINVVRAVELLKIAEDNALTQERIMRQVREKTEAGFNRVSELYNSESRLSLAKASYISRQQDLNQALVAFHRQFGRLLGPEQFVRPEPGYAPPATLPETIAIALEKHPALRVAQYNIETRRHTYEMAKAADYPTLDFELKTSYRNDTGGEEGDTTQSGAYLTLNYVFWDGGLREGEQAKEKMQIRKENERSYIERRNVNETARLAWNILEAESSKQGYLTDHVAKSYKTLDAFKEEYYAGRRTLLDLLNMENEYTDAKISQVDSEFSSLVAEYRLMQVTGTMLEAYVPGLRTALNLPAEEGPLVVPDEDLEKNRDHDRVEDLADQCDNTMSGAQVGTGGCKEDNVNTIGYPHSDSTPLAPYIAPQRYEMLPDEDMQQ